MNIKHTIITAFRALMTHKSRSALTVLGIVIGIASIITVMSLGNGAQSLILDQVSGLGEESLVIRPGEGFSTDFQSALFAKTLTQKDVDALQKQGNVPDLKTVSAFIIVPDPVEYRGEKYKPTVMGGSVEFMTNVFDIDVTNGETYREDDIDRYAKVAVIGYDIKDEIFESQDAIGKSISINNQKLRIVGVFPDTNSVGGFDFNNTVMIPHTTANRYITGSDHYNEIIVQANDSSNVERMVYDIETTIRDSHSLDFGEKSDFNIQTQQDLVEQIETITSILTAFLAAVVAISLVVGGIGIMNIMLVSVSERTKEIGLRKALGAKRRDILNQFLVEAVMLTALGGLIGVMLGASVSFVAGLVLAQTVAESWSFSFPIDAAIIAIIVSGGVGLIFGIYPANQAAKKSPIEALKYE